LRVAFAGWYLKAYLQEGHINLSLSPYYMYLKLDINGGSTSREALPGCLVYTVLMVKGLHSCKITHRSLPYSKLVIKIK
jgi:hypothetical protein